MTSSLLLIFNLHQYFIISFQLKLIVFKNFIDISEMSFGKPLCAGGCSVPWAEGVRGVCWV